MINIEDVNALALLVHTHVPLIVIETTEESRVIELTRELANTLTRPLQGWSTTRGLRRLDLDRPTQALKSTADGDALLEHILASKRPGVYVLFDFHPLLEESHFTRRLLKELAMECANGNKGAVLILVGHRIELPEGFRRLSAYFELPLPTHAQLEKLVREEAQTWARRNHGKRVTTDNKTFTRLVNNLRGLTHADARRLVRQVIWDDGAITDNEIPAINRGKFELMDMAGVLSFEYDTAHFSDVGGLRSLKLWIEKREVAFFRDTTLRQLEPPKGILLVGVQGGGKSLAAKAVAGVWNIPLMRLDFGCLYNKYHGETEKNLREALRMAELMSPCVLWMDEIEKGVATNDADGGTSRRVLGTLLTWMAENKAPVFIVATANDISGLPPELIRKGRLDEIFFVDLPQADIRADIFTIHLHKRQLNVADFLLPELAAATEGFTGAEIEQAVIAALYQSAFDEQPVSQDSLLQQIRETRPLSVVMAERLQALRQWAEQRTVPAN